MTKHVPVILGMLYVVFVSDAYVVGDHSVITMIMEYKHSIYQYVGLCLTLELQ